MIVLLAVSAASAVGATARYQLFPIELGSTASGDEQPSIAAFGLRLARIF